MVVFTNAVVWEVIHVIRNRQTSVSDAYDALLQGTVQELRNNPENGTIKEIEEIVYGDKMCVYIYSNNDIMYTPLWIRTDNAIPIAILNRR